MTWRFVLMLYLAGVVVSYAVLRWMIRTDEPCPQVCASDLWGMAVEDGEKPVALDAETREVPTVIVDLTRDSVREVTSTLKHWQER